MKLEHILVATDLSPEALECATPVPELARTVGARITLLHVVEAVAAIRRAAPFSPAIEEPGLIDEVEAARAALRDRREELGPGVEITPVVLTGEKPATVIVDYADEHDVDLIAVGTHGRTGFRHLVLGSVAEAVIRRSRVPVLVLPRPKR